MKKNHLYTLGFSFFILLLLFGVENAISYYKGYLSTNILVFKYAEFFTIVGIIFYLLFSILKKEYYYTIFLVGLFIFSIEFFCGHYLYYHHRRKLAIFGLFDRKPPGPTRFIRLRENLPNQTHFFESVAYPNGDMIELHIDKDGFIEPGKQFKNPDKKIFFLGGSTTKCAHVKELNRFPYLVGKLTSEFSNLKINTFNVGVSGNNSMHSTMVREDFKRKI